MCFLQLGFLICKLQTERMCWVRNTNPECCLVHPFSSGLEGNKDSLSPWCPCQLSKLPLPGPLGVVCSPGSMIVHVASASVIPRACCWLRACWDLEFGQPCNMTSGCWAVVPKGFCPVSLTSHLPTPIFVSLQELLWESDPLLDMSHRFSCQGCQSCCIMQLAPRRLMLPLHMPVPFSHYQLLHFSH